MMWIGATDKQRALMTRLDKEASEKARMAPSYQKWIRNEISSKVAIRDHKVLELENGGFARRLNRQIDDLNREIAELSANIR